MISYHASLYIILGFFNLTLCKRNITTVDYINADKQCIPNDPQGCSCKFSDNSGILDLRSLGKKDGTPLFKDIKGNDGNKYSFNPCNSFTEGKCVDAAVCVVQNGEDSKIGDAGRTLYQYSEGTSEVTAAYYFQTPDLIFVSEVTLVCEPTACEPQLTPEGQHSVGLYIVNVSPYIIVFNQNPSLKAAEQDTQICKFQLTSVCSCAGLCDRNGPINCKGSSGSTSWPFGVGTIILIGIIAAVGIYLVAGVLYLKVAKQASGKDLIPNKAFWFQVGTLITTGITFTFSKCLPKRLQYEATN